SVRMKSPSTRTGSFPAGFTARNSGRRCSPLVGSTLTNSNSTSNSRNVQTTRVERVGGEPIELQGVAVSFGPERRPSCAPCLHLLPISRHLWRRTVLGTVDTTHIGSL